MTIRRWNSLIAVLMVLVIAGFVVICSMDTANAYVDPSESEETAKTTAAQTEDSGTKKAETTESTKSKTKKKAAASSNNSNSSGSGSNSTDSTETGSNDDGDVLDENAFSTPGNATLGDMVVSSGSKDFYTIRTDNDNTYYLVIDHSGNMDNVYMLSTIDENDLQDFLEDSGSSGSLIIPETKTEEEPEAKVETPEKKPEKNRLSGIISLAILVAAGIAGLVIFRRYRRANEEPEDDYSENMEGDDLPTVNEDDEEFM